MIEEIKVLQVQARVANVRQMPEPKANLTDMMRALGERMIREAAE